MDLSFESPLPSQEFSGGEISDIRWERAREIDIRSVISDLTGEELKRLVISCPLGHGVGSSDRRPSFYVYPRTNTCHCYGCPPGDNHWDPVGFVSKILSLPPSKALAWLEKHYDLPPLVEAPQEEAPWLLSVADLEDSYIRRVSRSLVESRDPEEAKEYLRILFTSLQDPDGSPMRMAGVVGAERVKVLIRRKNGRR